MAEIVGFTNVRNAARDTTNFSSDLQGDRDVRIYRQLPLEVDPPRHHLYRTALTPIFVKPTIEKMVPEFEKISDRLIRHFKSKGGGDVVSELALPMVAHCLGVIYKRPQDVEEWLSWGPSVWMPTPSGRTGVHLDDYLKRVFDQAETHPSSDVWSFVSKIEIEGKRISRTEMYGIANVLLAGGRDTVVKLLTGAIWHLSTSVADQEFLRNNPGKFSDAIHEFLRYFTPLPSMERVPKEIHDLPEEDRDPANFVRISFVSANHDSIAFENPGFINIHRERNPHLAFGFGPHTCIGNHVAEIEAKVFLSTFLREVSAWEILERSEIEFETEQDSTFPGTFHSLHLKIEQHI